LASRCLHPIHAPGMVGCGPLHLAVLDWNASRRCGARRLGHRLDTLWIPDGQEHLLRPASLAADAARLVVQALLPAWCAVACVYGTHGVVRHRSDDLYLHAAADAQ